MTDRDTTEPKPQTDTLRSVRWFVVLWTVAVYVERFTYDYYLYGPDRNAPLAYLLRPECALLVAMAVPLLLLGVGLTPSALRAFERTLALAARRLKALALDWRAYLAVAGCVVLGLLVRAALKNEGYGSVLPGVVAAAVAKRDEVMYVLAVAAAAFGLWAVLRWLVHIPATVAVSEALHAWSAGAFFIVAFQVLAIALYAATIGSYLPSGSDTWVFAVSGILKDTMVYTIITLFVGSGLLEYESVLRTLPRRKVWLVFWALAGPAALVAAALLVVDVVFAGNVVLEPGSAWARVWHEERQRHAVHFHVYFRDLGLLVPGIVVMFARLAKKTALAAEAKPRKRGRSSAGETAN